MATSYSLTIKLPTTSTFTACNYGTYFEFSNGSGGAFSTVDLALADVKSSLEGQYGGNFTWTSAVVGSNTVYTISYVDLTTDPLNDVSGDLIAISISDDASSNFFGRFVPEDNTVIVQCDTCYELIKTACEDSYVFALDLVAGTDYTVAFIANNGNTYIQTITADGSGQLEVDATAEDFPPGFFTPDTGGYTVKIFTDIDLETVVPFTIGSNEYTCIQLGFQYVVTTTSSIQVNFEFLIHDDDDGSGDFYIVDDIGNTFIVG